MGFCSYVGRAAGYPGRDSGGCPAPGNEINLNYFMKQQIISADASVEVCSIPSQSFPVVLALVKRKQRYKQRCLA